MNCSSDVYKLVLEMEKYNHVPGIVSRLISNILLLSKKSENCEDVAVFVILLLFIRACLPYIRFLPVGVITNQIRKEAAKL